MQKRKEWVVSWVLGQTLVNFFCNNEEVKFYRDLFLSSVAFYWHTEPRENNLKSSLNNRDIFKPPANVQRKTNRHSNTCVTLTTAGEPSNACYFPTSHSVAEQSQQAAIHILLHQSKHLPVNAGIVHGKLRKLFITKVFTDWFQYAMYRFSFCMAQKPMIRNTLPLLLHLSKEETGYFATLDLWGAAAVATMAICDVSISCCKRLPVDYTIVLLTEEIKNSLILKAFSVPQSLTYSSSFLRFKVDSPITFKSILFLQAK